MKSYSNAAHLTLEFVDFVFFAVNFQNIWTVKIEILERIYSNQYTTDICLQGKIEAQVNSYAFVERVIGMVKSVCDMAGIYKKN